MTGGAKFHEGMDLAERFAFESGIMKMQMALEDVYLDIAKSSGKPTILLCDRGVMDTKAVRALICVLWKTTKNKRDLTNSFLTLARSL